MGRERKGEFAGDESAWMKAHESNLHGASGEHSKGAGGAPRVRIISILKALTGAAAIQAFSLSLGPGSKRRRGSVVGLGVAARASRKPAYPCHCCRVFRDVQVQVASHNEHALRTVTC